jgi:hypothetical protein
MMPMHGQLAIETAPVTVGKPLERGDLLLVHGSTRQLIDVTVARPTTLTQLRGPASSGAHLQPLVATAQAGKAQA